VVPVVDPEARVIEMYGRKVGTKLRGGTARHLFLGNTPPSPWLLDPAAEDGEIVITSSVMDALTWWAVGKRLVMVTPTIEVGHDPAAILAGRKLERVVFAYRRTDEARTIIEGAAQLIAELGMSAHRIIL